MTPLITAIFLASLVGSLHCAGMCGAFVALAVHDKDNSWRRHAILQGAYHGGRLISYLSLGIAAGALGHLLNLGGALAGIRSAAAVLAGATMLLFGLVALLRVIGVRTGRLAVPGFLARISQPIYSAAMNRPPVARALIIGLATTLLPCGWLYAFVVTAAATASPIRAALTMAIFWLGTLPVMMTLGAGMRTAMGPFQRRMPLVTCLMLMAVGLYTIVGRASINPLALARAVDSRATASAPTMNSAVCCEPNETHRP